MSAAKYATNKGTAVLYEVRTYENDVGRTVHEVRSPAGVSLGNYSDYHTALVRATFLARMSEDYKASDLRHTTTPGMYIEVCYAAYVKSMRLIGAQIAPPRDHWEELVATAIRRAL